MARTGEDPWQVGRERARPEQASFSYRNAQIVEAGHRVVGTLIGYPLPDTPEPMDPAMPAMFVAAWPELGEHRVRDLVRGDAWRCSINIEAKGLEPALLSFADGVASDLSLKGLSIIVSDGNSGARRLYESCGYRLVAQRQMVKEDWASDGRNWVILDQVS